MAEYSRSALWGTGSKFLFHQQGKLTHAESMLEGPESILTENCSLKYSYAPHFMSQCLVAIQFVLLARALLVTENKVSRLFCVLALNCKIGRVLWIDNILCGRMLLRLRRKAKGLISLSVHLLPHSY